MNKSKEEIMKLLQAPFPSKDIEWRVSRSGVSKNGKKWAVVLAYVDNRAIQNRLDEVFGPDGWKNEFHSFQDGIICTISCFIEGEWISKSDGAEKTKFESFKGGLSSAMKRAGVQWGIGRYLYNLPETIVEVVEQKPSPDAKYIHDKSNNVSGYWVPPKLPDWALPEDERMNQKKPEQKESRALPEKEKSDLMKKKARMIYYVAEKSGLLDKKLGVRLLSKINPKLTNTTNTTFVDVIKNATEQEIELYTEVFEPVWKLFQVANFYSVRVEDLLKYIQILHPENQIKSLLHCFGVLRKEDIQVIVDMVKDDLNDGTLKKTTIA